MALIVYSLLGFAVFLTTGLAWLRQVPGLHFDEAWAAEYARRISADHAFWPIDAMSPYAHPWAHYLTAIFFRYFGVSLFVYRAAGVAMCATGALLAWAALVRAGERKAAMIFPFFLGLFVPFVVNERFCVEITSFQVLCLGLLIFGAQLRSAALVFPAIFFGATSHILFLAPVLGLLAVWGLQSGKWQLSRRALVLVIAGSFWPFLWKIHREIPEKDKSFLLLAADATIILFVLVFDQMPRAIRRMRASIRLTVAVLSIPFFLYLGFFSEGHWPVLFSTGKLAHPWLLWITVPTTVLGILNLLRAYRRMSWSPPQQRFWSWLLFTVFFLGVLAVKPAPRYFQMAFFLVGLGSSVLLAHVSARRLVGFLAPFTVASGLILSLDYLEPGLRSQVVDRSYRFLIFHDNSEDSLPKQELARMLGERGCSYSQVVTDDPRLDETLRFLSRGDWPISPQTRCPGSRVRVARGSPFQVSWEN